MFRAFRVLKATQTIALITPSRAVHDYVAALSVPLSFVARLRDAAHRVPPLQANFVACASK